MYMLKGSPRSKLKVIAIEAFNCITKAFPNLITSSDEDPNVDLSIIIPEQLGIEFAINLNLQTDELHLSTQYFSGSWFPITKHSVVQQYTQSVIGLIKGEYRIV